MRRFVFTLALIAGASARLTAAAEDPAPVDAPVYFPMRAIQLVPIQQATS